jgi:F0F1-type ATP synthase membrane subunit b/b'
MLYLSVALVILPRIRGIIEARKTVVNSDKNSAKKLEKQVEDLDQKANQIKAEASDKYDSKLEEVSKNIVKERDLVLTSLKADLDEKAKKSRQEIKTFVSQSEDRISQAISSISQNIKSKILS